jgi:predicted Rossmann fold flavoprotein
MDVRPTIAIIGAGAAGLMAAIHAAGSGARVILLERLNDGGRKILISGGGRCNVLPAALDERRFVTASSTSSMRKILRAWPLEQMRTFFEQDAALPLRLEEDTGKLFPVANSSRAVRDALRDLATRRGVEWRTRAQVTALQPDPSGTWQLRLEDGHVLEASAVVIATGGLSVPSTGSDGFAFRALASLGHTIHPTYPALTPLTLDPPRWADLAGLSLEATVAAASAHDHREAHGGFLFTHRGYSGPAVLDVSHVAVRGRLAGESKAALTVSWTPYDREAWRTMLAPASGQVGTVVRRAMPARLAERLLQEAAVPADTALSRFARADRERLVELLTAFPLPWTSDEGYKKAEVTGGGVALEEVQPATLESRIHKGLFLAGELLDAFGPIGGYNFTWAWVTGRQAGLGAARQATRDP